MSTAISSSDIADRVEGNIEMEKAENDEDEQEGEGEGEDEDFLRLFPLTYLIVSRSTNWQFLLHVCQTDIRLLAFCVSIV